MELINFTKKVKNFYDDLPFNYHRTTNEACKDIRNNPIKTYPDVDKLFSSDKVNSIIEFGCGVGWFSNSASYHYNLSAMGIDLSTKAVKRARDVSLSLKIEQKTTFYNCDLFGYKKKQTYDFVVSIGVLPAVDDPLKGFMHIKDFVAPNKYLFIGLYHYYGRKVFKKLFDEILDKYGEKEALRKYRSLHRNLNDKILINSWFRDQVLHPSEKWHTLFDVTQWLDSAGFELVSTSINKFKPFSSIDDLIEMEKEYEALSYKANYKEKRYFPGFFTVLARKVDENAVCLNEIRLEIKE